MGYDLFRRMTGSMDDDENQKRNGRKKRNSTNLSGGLGTVPENVPALTASGRPKPLTKEQKRVADEVEARK